MHIDLAILGSIPVATRSPSRPPRERDASCSSALDHMCEICAHRTKSQKISCAKTSFPASVENPSHIFCHEEARREKIDACAAFAFRGTAVSCINAPCALLLACDRSLAQQFMFFSFFVLGHVACFHSNHTTFRTQSLSKERRSPDFAPRIGLNLQANTPSLTTSIFVLGTGRSVLCSSCHCCCCPHDPKLLRRRTTLCRVMEICYQHRTYIFFLFFQLGGCAGCCFGLLPVVRSAGFLSTYIYCVLCSRKNSRNLSGIL